MKQHNITSICSSNECRHRWKRAWSNIHEEGQEGSCSSRCQRKELGRITRWSSRCWRMISERLAMWTFNKKDWPCREREGEQDILRVRWHRLKRAAMSHSRLSTLGMAMVQRDLSLHLDWLTLTIKFKLYTARRPSRELLKEKASSPSSSQKHMVNHSHPSSIWNCKTNKVQPGTTWIMNNNSHNSSFDNLSECTNEATRSK